MYDNYQFFPLMTFLGKIIKIFYNRNFFENVIPTLNKEMEVLMLPSKRNQALMLKMYSITEQRFFLVKTYYKTSSYLEVKRGFSQKISR